MIIELYGYEDNIKFGWLIDGFLKLCRIQNKVYFMDIIYCQLVRKLKWRLNS